MTTIHPDRALAALTDEQMLLWNDLDEAIRYAHNGTWSIKSIGLAARIVRIGRIIGATPIEKLPWSLTAGGVYEALCELAGIACEDVASEEWARMEQSLLSMSPEMRTRVDLQTGYAATITEMRASWTSIEGSAAEDAYA